MTGRCLNAALAYAELDWQVVPLNWPVTIDSNLGCSCKRRLECASPGKHPWIRWKDNGGTTDPEQIREWFQRRWSSNVGILTGRKRSGLFVIDIDPDHGGDVTCIALQTAHGVLPDTLTAVTGSGGRHLLFRYPEGKVRQTAGALGPGVDTRSDGGLIVAAPSLHRSGDRYRWTNWGTSPAELPEWVLERLKPKPTPPPKPLPARSTARGSRYAEVALERAIGDLHRLAGVQGERNWELNRKAYSLGRLAGGGLISADRAGHALLEAAIAIGLGQQEAEDTIISGLEAGAQAPRGVPA